MTKIKICGVMSCHEAVMVGEAGVEYIGINFVENSQRFVHKEKAIEISRLIHTRFPQIKLVGIFQDDDLAYVNLAAHHYNLDLLQLHGAETDNYIKLLEAPVIKTVSNSSHIADFPSATYFLFDPYDLAPICSTRKCFVAGGLSPQNVGEMIQIAKPYAVDVSSGVRIKSSIDKALLYEFIYAVKSQKIISS